MGLRRQGSYQTGNSIDRGSYQTGNSIDRDRMSVSSGDSHSTYDHPKTVLKVTSSPLALKRNPSSSTVGLPTSPLRRAMSERASSVTSHVSANSDIRRMIAATPCSCDGPGPGAGQFQQHSQGAGFENYDIPRNLGRQEALQFYDTPRNVREAIECANYQGGMGNYDIPLSGALPVFRKPCGCVLKLTNNGDIGDDSSAVPGSVLTWTCVNDDGGHDGVNGDELKIPRVKLTGQGRMPVVDMSKINALT